MGHLHHVGSVVYNDIAEAICGVLGNSLHGLGSGSASVDITNLDPMYW